MEPMSVLLDRSGAGAGPELPPALVALYGGGLALPADAVYANFVSSLDGVVSLVAPRGAGPTIRGRCEADRFVMGLLRLAADAIVVGAGTLRDEPGREWTAAAIDRERAD